jgi:hypothetical protein
LEDSLPPFCALTTDEEREMKAELKEPGIYFVVANPKSFEDLPEYREGEISGFDTTQGFLPSTHSRTHEAPLTAPSGSVIEDSEDPNTIILKAFEAPVRRGSTQLNNNSTLAPTPLSSLVVPPIYPLQVYPRDLVDPNTSNLDNARAGGRDSELLQHYRTCTSIT